MSEVPEAIHRADVTANSIRAASGAQEDSENGSKSRWQRSDTLLIVMALLLWLCLIPLFSAPLFLDEKLDASWQYCNAYFLKNHFHAGVDYIFPTTLLGHFYGSVYDPALFFYTLACQLALNALLTYNLFRLAKFYPAPWMRCGVLLACALFLPLSTDAISIVLLLTIAQTLIFSQTSSPARIACNIGALAWLSHVKFTYLLLALIIILLSAIAPFAFRLPKRIMPALGGLTLYFACFLGIWLALRQPLAGLPIFFRNLLSISLNYNNAMGSEGDRRNVLVGAATLAGLGGMLLWFMLKQDWQGKLAALTMGVFLLELWKHGFIRNDGIHAIIFFVYALVCTLLLPVYTGAYQSLPAWTRGARLLITVICLLCMVSIKGGIEKTFAHPLPGIGLLLRPRQTYQELGRRSDLAAALWELPQIKRIVQNEPVDMFGAEQFVVLLNHLNYRPRPVYQSYSAYAPDLIALNGDFYRGFHAPAYIVFRFFPIDGHLPAMEDSDALGELLRRYHPIVTEKGYILLARNQASASLPAPFSTFSSSSSSSFSPFSAAQAPNTLARITRHVHLGEEVRVDDGADCHLLSVRCYATAWGKLRALALHPATIALNVRTASGATRFSLIPDVAKATFVLDPLLRTARDVIKLYGNLPGERVQSFRVEATGNPGRWFKDDVEITLTACPRPIGQRISKAQADALLQPGNWAQPQ